MHMIASSWILAISHTPVKWNVFGHARICISTTSHMDEVSESPLYIGRRKSHDLKSTLTTFQTKYSSTVLFHYINTYRSAIFHPKNPYQYYKSCKNPYQVIQVTHTASQHAMNSYDKIINNHYHHSTKLSWIKYHSFVAIGIVTRAAHS